MRIVICLLALMTLFVATPIHAGVIAQRTVIYDEVATELTVAPPATIQPTTRDLWLTLSDLTRATKFVLKPQGVCRDELCFPIPKARKGAFLTVQRNGGKSTTWFNLSEFARLVKQPEAIDEEQAIWYYGPRQSVQNSHTASFVAPDFRLADMKGVQHSLRSFRGKKVLLLTWASW